MADIVFQNSADGLFDILNQIFTLQTQVDASTVDRRSQWDSLRDLFGAEFSDATWTGIVSLAEQNVSAEETGPSAVVSALRSMAEQTVIQKVDSAVNLTVKTLDAALSEVVSQMIEQGESLLLPAVTIAVVANSGNTGDLVMVASRKTVAGVDNPQLLAEVIDVSALSAGGSVALAVTSDAVSDGLSPNGFGGSGINAYLNFYTTLTGLTGSSGLNSFTASSSVLPGNWIANVGTLGTDVLSGQPQVSTITVTGTPTSGTFRITCATSSLGTQSTGNLSFDATAAQIMSAILSMTGFSRVSVSATGTGPNYIHSLTFYGMREAVTVAVVNSTNSGSFAVATPTAYATPSFGSSPIVLVSDGSTLVSVTHVLTNLSVNTAYAVNAWLALNTTAASGVIEFSLTNGVGGTIIQDDAGNDLKYTIQATDLTTSYQGSAKLMAGGFSQAWTLAISGTPTGGTYTITLTDAVNGARTTSALAYNASSATVQTALRLLSGAGINTLTVSSTGTTPNFTHTIQFNGTAVSITVTASAASLTGGTPVLTPAQTVAFAVLSPIWMTPAVLPASVYLRIRCSTTLPNTRQVYIENVVIAPATQIYSGGPFVGMFSGPVGPKAGDLWAITTTNDRAGKMSLGMERNFNLRERGLVIPHDASPTITEFTPVAPGSGTCFFNWDVVNSVWVLYTDNCITGTPTEPASPGGASPETRAGTCVI